MATILVADDDETLPPLLESILSGAGHDLSIAREGRKAYELIRRVDFDLIILDHDMPEKTGVEVLSQLRLEKIALPPVIMLTARGESDIVQTCLAAGAKDYIVKPFKVDEVARRVQKFLGAG